MRPVRWNSAKDVLPPLFKELKGIKRRTGLYIHVPFCIRKCPYCNFYSIEERGALPRYLQALLLEIEIWQKILPVPPFDTLYLGGGTPSLLAPDQVHRILQKVFTAFSFVSRPEITIEVNPGTVTRASLFQYKKLGINRLQIGIQSFDSQSLRFLGRIHNAEEGMKTIDMARDAGFDNVGLDIIYCLPGQSRVSLERDLCKALTFSPEHLSAYLLTIEKDTPFAKMVGAGTFAEPDEDLCAVLFDHVSIFLADKGYHHYEISNYARTCRYESRHNRKYWNRTPYLGMGPGAHSFFTPHRWWNIADVDAYCSTIEKGNLPVEAHETLSVETMWLEEIYLGLRKTQGICLNRFSASWGKDFSAIFQKPLQRLEEEGLIEVFQNAVQLTQKGRKYHETVCIRLAEKIPENFPE